VIEGRATARYVRTSAQKAKLVIDLIRGKDVDNALATLRFARKGVAKDVEKVLRSAIANAQQKQGGADEVERLFVRECFADQGPMLKRIRAAPMGRAFRILKRTSHLTVIVEERPAGPPSRARRRPGGAGGTGSGGGGGTRDRAAALRGPETASEPEVPAGRTPPAPDVTETDAMPEPVEPERESEAPEPEEEAEAPEPEERPESAEKSEPEEPGGEPPTRSPGGILGIR
jgi:large subunit ribosomal protein L22